MTKPTTGMEPLILAERRASELINDAKRKRMKLAKEEALLEIDRFKEECETKFQNKLREQDDISAVKARGEEIKSAKLKELHRCYEEKKDSAVEEIIRCVKSIQPQLPKYYEPYS